MNSHRPVKYLSITFVLLLALLVTASLAFSMSPQIRSQVITATPQFQIVTSTPFFDAVVDPVPIEVIAPIAIEADTSGLLPLVLGIVASVVAGIVTILTGIAVSRNYGAKTTADILRMEAEIKRNNEIAAVDIARKKAETDAFVVQADADSKKKKAETDNLEAETRSKIAATDAIKDQLAAEVANTLAKSNAEAFTDMRSSLAVFRADITNLTGKNDDLLKTVREQNTRLDNMLDALEHIKSFGDGPKDVAEAATAKDAATRIANPR